MIKTAILQSGLLSYLGPNLILPTTNSKPSILQAMKVEVTPDLSKSYFYDLSITNIFRTYVENPDIIKDFDFVESIFKTAKVIFNTKSFYNWCSIQTENPYFTAIHKKFILDTLSFLDTGKREISISSWSNLIEIKPITYQDKSTVFNYKDYFKNSNPLEPVSARPLTIEESLNLCPWSSIDGLIVQFVKQPNGVEDLLYFLNIVFGNKH